MLTDVGEKAPDPAPPSDSWDERISPSSYMDEGPVVPSYYSGDWSNACTDQSGRVRVEVGSFEALGAKEWGIESPLLSDLGRGAVYSYSVRHVSGYPKRAYFVMDRDGMVRRTRKVEASPKDRPDVEAVLGDSGRV